MWEFSHRCGVRSFFWRDCHGSIRSSLRRFSAHRQDKRRRAEAQARHRRLFFETYEDRIMLDATPWNNLAFPQDVDADGIVTASDAHVIEEMVNANGGAPIDVPMDGMGPPYADADGNWLVNQDDWQMVNDYLNGGEAG